jgi:hypothetical protein
MQQEFLLAGMVLLVGAALFLAFRFWKKDQGQRVDPRTEHEFNKVFMTTHKEGKEALIKHWTDKGLSRGKAMQQAIYDWRRDNR